MEIINSEIDQILIENIDLFKFMKLNKLDIENNMFSSEYKKKLKKAYISNSKVFHTDKYPDATDEQKEELEKLFNLNNIVYNILSNEDHYNKFIQMKSEIISDHNNLKDAFGRFSKLYEKSGKTFDQLNAEKDLERNYDRSLEQVISIETYNDLLDNLKKMRDKMDIKYSTNIDKFDKDKFDKDKFNKLFDGNVNKSAEPTELVPFNDNQQTAVFSYNSFNYSDIYDPTIVDINKSYGLISSEIPSIITLDKTLDEKIKEYEVATSQIVKNITKESV